MRTRPVIRKPNKGRKLPPVMGTKNAQYRRGDYALVTQFTGYRAREDHTKLANTFLVSPSQNVVINTSGRLAHVRGYALDGTGSTVIDSGILSNFDFTNFKGDVRNLRAGFLTDAGNDGKIQYRYVDSSNAVHWIDLMTALTNVRISYTDYWDNSALVRNVLWVDGTNNIFNWNGAVTTVASAATNTITKQGTLTWAQEGFSATGSIRINGTLAAYTGGYDTMTLTGVTVDLSATVVGSIIHQEPVTVALSAMTSILATFGPTVIGCGRRNQVYVGSNKSNVLYISKVNSYTDYSFTSPVRVVGEGALIPLDAPPTKFVPQEVRDETLAYDMYISEGSDHWGVIRATLSSDLTSEKLEHIRLKNGSGQAALSERLCTKMKNQILFVSHENIANFLGYLSFQFVPEITDFSWPIVDDMNNYDYTDASIFYHRNYIYIAIPRAGVVRVYNMTNQTQQTPNIRGVENIVDQPWFWEAPLTYPVSGFYVVNGDLYGHGFTTSESYKLFTGGSFNGQDIETNATFAYDDFGERTQSKRSNEIWIEGYIKQNTDLNCDIISDLDSFTATQTVVVNGNDSTIVAFGSGGHALGKDPLGSKPLGGTSIAASLPAWFHCAKTYSQSPTPYLEQLSFHTKGVDLDWQLLCFGTNKALTKEGNMAITE